MARRVHVQDARAHFEQGGTVVVSERGDQLAFPVGPNTTTHDRTRITWEQLTETVQDWRNRYPRQRFYVVEDAPAPAADDAGTVTAVTGTYVRHNGRRLALEFAPDRRDRVRAFVDRVLVYEIPGGLAELSAPATLDALRAYADQPLVADVHRAHPVSSGPFCIAYDNHTDRPAAARSTFVRDDVTCPACLATYEPGGDDPRKLADDAETRHAVEWASARVDDAAAALREAFHSCDTAAIERATAARDAAQAELRRVLAERFPHIVKTAADAPVNAGEHIARGPIWHVYRRGGGHAAGPVGYLEALGILDDGPSGSYVSEYGPGTADTSAGVCSQCKPGHDRGDGRCGRHGKTIDAPDQADGFVSGWAALMGGAR
jgi:hypothetical protein